MRDERYVGAGPAHVQTDEVHHSRQLAVERRAVDAPRRPGQDSTGSQTASGASWQYPTVGLHHQDVVPIPYPVQALSQTSQIVGEGTAHIRIDDGCTQPVVLADLGQYLVGQTGV